MTLAMIGVRDGLLMLGLMVVLLLVVIVVTGGRR